MNHVIRENRKSEYREWQFIQYPPKRYTYYMCNEQNVCVLRLNEEKEKKHIETIRISQFVLFFSHLVLFSSTSTQMHVQYDQLVFWNRHTEWHFMSFQ